MKVETHNHPTAISPFPGAATGSGGEIRDEGATGIGAKPKAGLTGFSVSNLRIPGMVQPWEADSGKPERIASALRDHDRGARWGPPHSTTSSAVRPHAAISARSSSEPRMAAMRAGARLSQAHHDRRAASATCAAATSRSATSWSGAARRARRTLDADRLGRRSRLFGRQRPELGRAGFRLACSAAIPRCSDARRKSSIDAGRTEPATRSFSIHDVGAGGLSNALARGHRAQSPARGRIDLRKIPSAEPDLSPMEIWCNEAQERYVLVAGARSASSRFSPRCASASAVPSRWSARSPATAGCA